MVANPVWHSQKAHSLQVGRSTLKAPHLWYGAFNIGTPDGITPTGRYANEPGLAKPDGRFSPEPQNKKADE